MRTVSSLTNLKLGIISDAQHYYDSNGRLYALAILARQFEQWAQLFADVTICAPLIDGPPPVTHTSYQAENIHLLPIVSAGGDTPQAKLDLIYRLGGWWHVLRSLLRQVDAIHIRCPNNISIPGLYALIFSQHLRQALYTGNWLGYPGEPATYRAQRLFLKYFFHGPVAVYGEWPDQPDRIVPSFSPSYSQMDWVEESQQVQARLERLASAGREAGPVVLLSVGALNRNKNQQLVLRAISLLQERGLEVELHLVGEGSEEQRLLELSKRLGITDRLIFHGGLPHDCVRRLYRRSDFVVQPSYTEGYSKVPIEAMFHGAVPILSNVSTNPQIVAGDQRGRCFGPDDGRGLADHIQELSNDPIEMTRLILNGRYYARERTLEAWRDHIQQMLEANW